MSVIHTNTLLLRLQFMWCLSQKSTSEGLRVGFLPPEDKIFIRSLLGGKCRTLLQHMNRKF